MKTLTLLVMTLILAGCGKDAAGFKAQLSPKAPGPCASVAVGSWRPVNYNPAGNYNTLTLTDQCTGTTTYCNEVFTYAPQSDGRTAFITVTSTNGGPECLPLGVSTCTVDVIPNQSNNQIAVDCGGGKNLTNNYNRL